MGRLLRPVCQTLGLKQPDYLRLPRRTRARKPEGNPPRRQFRLNFKARRGFLPLVRFRGEEL
ncbi:MAG: hypothetical protein JOY70_05730 [Acidisphaera sp.]|nr:hypothetical protein [Acidisphaera sp.]